MRNIPEGLKVPVHSQSAMESWLAQPCPLPPLAMGPGQESSTAPVATGRQFSHSQEWNHLEAS